MLNNKSEQIGRSMVEMLGVLAVIGVLSITGISGYTTAMNKHKANEILDAASKRAVAVSTQIQRGNTNPTLAEFEDYKVGGAKFDTQIGTQGTDKFVIKFTEEPSDEVWSQIQSIAGTSGVVRGYTTDTLGLVYNNDLTTDAKASDNNGKGAETCGSGNTYCSGSGLCLEGTNQTCTCSGTRPACKKCDTTKGSYDLADTSLNTKQDLCTAGNVCNNGECKSAETTYRIGRNGQHWDDVAEASLYSSVNTPKDDVCPSGYRWAGYDDVKNLGTSVRASIFSDRTLCMDCSHSHSLYWLKDCPNEDYSDTDDCTDSTTYGWMMDYTGSVLGNDVQRVHSFFALCVKNS